MPDIFDDIADERRKLCDDLDTLGAAQWESPSAIPTWTVRHVVAHLVWPLTTPTWKLMLQMARAGFDFNRMTDQVAFAEQRKGPELAKLLRAHANHRFIPPGGGPTQPLTDVIVHGCDIRYPLGLKVPITESRVQRVLNLLVSPAGARRISLPGLPDGLRFEATDMAWSHGDGPLVKGPAAALLLSTAARRVALDALQGEGVATLRARLGAG